MKVYKLEVMVIDFDELGTQGMIDTLENTTYPNRCMNPRVMSIEERDIGKWTDDHPLNKSGAKEEFRRLFSAEDR